MLKTSFNQGYIGLISLLLAVLIISFLVISFYRSSLGDGLKTEQGIGTRAIDQAQQAKDLIEKNNLQLK